MTRKNLFSADAPVDFTKDFGIIFNNRVSKFSHDRTKSVGASEVFGCSRQNWFRNHYPQDTIKEWGYLERGNVIEDAFVVPFLIERFGAENCIGAGQKNQTTLHLGANTATPDCLVINQSPNVLSNLGIDDIGESGAFVVEIKSYDARAHLSKEKSIHRGQIITQMGLYRETTEYKPEYGVVLYVNSSDFRDIRAFAVQFNEKIFKQAQKRANDVLRAKNASDLRAEGAISKMCTYCEYSDRCDDVEVHNYGSGNDAADMDEDYANSLNACAKNFTHLSEQIDELSEKKRVLRQEIQNMLNKDDRSRADVPNYRIVLSRRKGNKTIDMKRLSECLSKNGEDLNEFMKEGHGFFSLRVTKLDE